MNMEDRFASLSGEVEDHRVVRCEACGSEGRIYEACWTYDRQAGGMIPDQIDTGPCPYCEGTGGEIIMTQPITLEDLDELTARSAASTTP